MELDLAVLATSQPDTSDPWLTPRTPRGSAPPSVGPASVGPASSGAGYRSVTPPSMGPASVGPASVGPASSGPASVGPAYGSVMPPSMARPSVGPISPVSIAPPSMPIPSWRIPSNQPELRVMVVDDDPTMLRLYERILLKRGVIVSAATGPEEALQSVSALAPEHRPHMVFLDVVMPRLNGGAFIAALRGIAGDVQVPVVLVSALNLNTVRDYAMQWGANGFVLKSKGLIHLEHAFDEWVKHVSDRESARIYQ